jgi:hypothetical protein
MAGSTASVWHCQGCGVALNPDELDTWCHTCLLVLREKLSRSLLNGHHGLAFGPSLEDLWRKPVRAGHYWDFYRPLPEG